MIKLRRYILLMLVLMTSINTFAQDADDDTGAKQGLKGFVELAGGKGLGLQGTGRAYVTGVCGYQICPVVFAGLGFTHDFKNNLNHLFVDSRVTMNKKISPFAGVRVGANMTNNRVYWELSAGCRYGLDNGMALNFGLSVDYTMTWHHDIVPQVYYDNLEGVKKIYNANVKTLTDNYALCLKTSIEF